MLAFISRKYDDVCSQKVARTWKKKEIHREPRGIGCIPAAGNVEMIEKESGELEILAELGFVYSAWQALSSRPEEAEAALRLRVSDP